MALRRRAVAFLLALFVLIPAGVASASTTGGVSAPSSSPTSTPDVRSSGGAAVGAVTAHPPAPAKKKKKKRKKKKGHRHPAPQQNPSTAPPASGWAFPVNGPHNFGGAGARFGAPRGNHTHQGQDILAAEGTPEVAPHAGTIKYVANQPAGAGIYIVMHASGTNYDFALMHIQPGSVRVHVGQTVAAGDQIAKVGHTGDAQGPHLHFEVWVGPWQTGGHAIDPLPLLKSWPGA
jgi:murein DD-endopeptidase MepM/ murein hydrolase activator NlpD